jgi:adenosylmethionine-8-amino-7-oxononanoate aminotransferase
MLDWCKPEHEPLVLVEGYGALLRDSLGREYIDGNSSIWTNLHGHNHPRINDAIRAQLDRVAHTSFLGFTNPPAIQLAEELLDLANTQNGVRHAHYSRVFYSDNGSTAIEVALKMAAQFWQLSGQPQRQRFVAFTNAYHGDTMGASSLGGVKSFHERFSAWQFPVTHVESMDELDSLADPHDIAAVVIEPLIQGAAGMRLWPKGMLASLRRWCDRTGVLLITDEVMTAFGRTGKMFASEQESVFPDFLACAKGLTGGTMPLAATLTTERVFNAFLGSADRTLYYGHTYTGHQLGCAAALANLAIFRDENVLELLQGKISRMGVLLQRLAALPHVFEVRQCGFMAGIDLKENGTLPFAPENLVGARVCQEARKHGLLTRPVRDTLVFMPPYCITDAQLAQAVDALERAIGTVCDHS